MKVLLLGDYSNYHASLASGLRGLGHDVPVASDGCSWLEAGCDIKLSRRQNKIGGAWLYARVQWLLSGRLKGFDVVHVRDPYFIELKPRLLEGIMKRLKRDNGNIFLSSLSTDSLFVRNLCSPSPALEYSEWQIDGHPTEWSLTENSKRHLWLDPALVDYTEAFYGRLDGVVSSLYEYHKVVAANFPSLPLHYAGIPIDTSTLPAPRIRSGRGPVRILCSAHRGRAGEKGIDLLLPMLKRLEAELPGKVEIITPPNVSLDKFKEILSSVDLVCDQLYSYTPATTALMGMAMGVVPISGGEEDFYRFVGEKELRPVFNPDPRDIEGTYRRLAELVQNPELLRRMSADGPEFVRRHNSSALIAKRFSDAWDKMCR